MLFEPRGCTICHFAPFHPYCPSVARPLKEHAYELGSLGFWLLPTSYFDRALLGSKAKERARGVISPQAPERHPPLNASPVAN